MPGEAAMVARRTRVMIGPAIAPVVSMLRWKPNAFPRVSAGGDSVKSGARGAARTPFPVRSTIRIPGNSGQLFANGKKPFINCERADPAPTNRFRFPDAPENQHR